MSLSVTEMFVDNREQEAATCESDVDKRITALQAAWNVTNAIQGMFIVGLPIAVKVFILGLET